MDLEPELVEVFGDQDGVGLLAIQPDGQSLDTSKEKERIERRQAVADRVDGKCNGLGDVLPVAAYNAGHEVVMATQVFCSRIVDDVGAMIEGALKVGTHHRVVDDDDSLGHKRMDEVRDGGDIGDLNQGIGRGFDQNQADARVGSHEEGNQGFRGSRGDVMGDDPIVRFEVRQQTV
jgi:hypothetical protein